MSGNLLIGLAALGVGWVALTRSQANQAVKNDQSAPEKQTIDNETQPLGPDAPTVQVPVGQSANLAAARRAPSLPDGGRVNTGSSSGNVGGDSSVSPGVSDNMSGLGVVPAKDNGDNPVSGTGTGGCSATSDEFCGGTTPGGGDAPAGAQQTVQRVDSASFIAASIYGIGQTVTPKEESASMETYGPQGGFVW